MDRTKWSELVKHIVDTNRQSAHAERVRDQHKCIPFSLNVVQHIFNGKTITHKMQTPTPQIHNTTASYTSIYANILRDTLRDQM